MDDGPAPALRQLQLVELDILKEFVRLCQAHGLRYYLAYGTLLGAVRNEAFIPWDDDIDVTMPRQDYNRLAELATSELGPTYRLQSYATDEAYPLLFAKLLRNETVLRQAPSSHLRFQQSVYIDIFPLDGCATSRWAVLLQRLTVRLCRVRLRSQVRRPPVRRALAQVTRIIPRRLAIAAFEAMSRAVPAQHARTLICTGGPYGFRKQVFPSEWFEAGESQRFEGLVLTGPAQWHNYLAQLYGDYMTPPPAEARVSHHEVTEIQLG